jgi:putative spermidine/putrescine transport system substrate-binding protein
MMKTLGRRKFLKAAAAAGGAALLPMPAVAKNLKGTGEVVVYDGGGAWGDAKRIAYFEPFEAETGIRVIAEPRTEDGAIRASIMAGAPRYDVAILSGGSSPSFARDGLLLPIDYSFFEQADIDGFKAVTPAEFSVAHIIYSLLIAYDPDAFPSGGPQSWADVWDVESFPGGRSIGPGTWGSDAATFEAALLADGVAPADLYPLDWERAFRSLDRIKPHIVKFWNSGAEGPQLIIDKQITAGSAWNGRISAANEQGAKIGFTWNQGVLQYDNWVVPKGAANVDNAWRFLAFAARPENQAKFAENILYAPPNDGAYQFLAPERATQLPTSPEAVGQQLVQNYEFWNTPREDGVANNQFAVAQWEKWLAGA